MSAASVAPPPFALAVRPDRQRVVVTVTGEVDLLTAPAVADEVLPLLDRGFADVVVDLGGATFLETAGVRMLLHCHAAAGERAARLTVRGAGPAVRRPLELTGVLGRLEGTEPVPA